MLSNRPYTIGIILCQLFILANIYLFSRYT
mgnify:CR=1 FL=1